MGTMSVLGRKGDTEIAWDPKNKDEVLAVRNQFDELVGKGFLAFEVEKDGGKGKQIKKFKVKAGKVILIPPIVGG